MGRYPCVHRDYETRSILDLRKCGAHVYAEHPSTEITVAVWIVETSPGTVEKPWTWRPDQEFPQPVRGLIEGGARVVGHNAAFEAVVDRAIAGSRLGWPVPKLAQLDCTMARAAAQGLPLGLGEACMALGLIDHKDIEGSRLMKMMTKPRRIQPGPQWHEDDARMARLIAYCIADVRAAIGLDRALAPLSPQERAIWELTEVINNRGVEIDLGFVGKAQAFIDRATARADQRMAEITGGQVQRVSNIGGLKAWMGYTGKADVVNLQEILDKNSTIGPGKLLPAVREAIQLRLDAGKTSLRKLPRFLAYGKRARGCLQYHAAATGRWGGRGIQLQNLVRTGVTGSGGWEQACRDLQDYDAGTVELIWGSPFGLVSRMLRGALVAAPGHVLLWGDYASVEARGCAWASGQKDQLELFRQDGPVYETMASLIFGKPIGAITPEQRFFGKTAVLGCSYGMGWKRFQATCQKAGRVIGEAFARRAVDAWRHANGRTVGFWRELEHAAMDAVDYPGGMFKAGPYAYRCEGKWLKCRLPSGRFLWYCEPQVITTPERSVLTYMGVGTTHQWTRETTWGGKLLENATQGLCRDFLAAAQLRLEGAGFPVVMHVHDEIIAEVAADQDGKRGFCPDLRPEQKHGSCPGLQTEQERFASLMAMAPAWGRGFPLSVKTYSGTRYGKE